MAYNPVTDFVGLWRTVAGGVSKAEMPGLDFVASALARAGIITLSVSATAPVANQATTAWLKAAVPSYSAEGVLYLWDSTTTTYLPATPALFMRFLHAAGGQNGVSWWVSTGGPPANTVGNDGDLAIRTDEPGGVYGPKALGAWPATAVPGTVNVVSSIALDNTFGTTPGQMIYRGAADWLALPVGPVGSVMTPSGGIPSWEELSALMDAVFGSVQGSILYRGAAAWDDLGPGTAGQVLSTAGPGAPPAWSARTAEFPSGTGMVFRQTAAPTGWTKQVALNDYGLRVTAGAVGTTAGTPFSTVFAQSAVGATTLSTAQMPSHTHTHNAQQNTGGNSDGGGGPGSLVAFSPATINANGSSGSHTHSIGLTLSYLDVIIATKD